MRGGRPPGPERSGLAVQELLPVSDQRGRHEVMGRVGVGLEGSRGSSEAVTPAPAEGDRA